MRLSTEKILQNRGDPINVSTVQNVGACSNRAAFAVTNVAQEILIGAGKRTIELIVSGAEDVYYGGAGVTVLTGSPIYSGQGKIWANVKDDFSVYVITVVAGSELRITEYT
jgi:hypothetical protein